MPPIPPSRPCPLLSQGDVPPTTVPVPVWGRVSPSPELGRGRGVVCGDGGVWKADERYKKVKGSVVCKDAGGVPAGVPLQERVSHLAGKRGGAGMCVWCVACVCVCV